MKGMPPSGCSDNAFELFQWLEQLVPISGYPPKVPFLSLESAIGTTVKLYLNGTKVPPVIWSMLFISSFITIFCLFLHFYDVERNFREKE